MSSDTHKNAPIKNAPTEAGKLRSAAAHLSDIGGSSSVYAFGAVKKEVAAP